MIIRRQLTDQNLVINTEQDFQTDLGWESNLMLFEEEVLKDIINPVDNFETVRYIHSPYTSSGVTQTDIWFYFYFIGSGGTYIQDYQVVGISNQENEQLLPQSTKSFFRLELFKTPGTVTNNVLTCEPPTRRNRKLVFAKNLSLPIGEKVFDSTLRGHLHIPIFTGSNYRNKENMYMFWFADESVLTETNLSGSTTGNTFFMTAKFYNADNGDKLDFINECRPTDYTINEARDMYYQVDINKTDYSYKIYQYSNGTKGSPVGLISNPIKFYEKGGAGCPVLTGTTPTPTPTITRTPAATSAGPAVSPTQTPTMTITPSPFFRYYKVQRCDDETIIKYSVVYNNNTFTYGDRVYWGSVDIVYVVIDTFDPAITSPPVPSYDLIQITRSLDPISLQPLRDCPNTGTTTPGYSQITLIRGNTNNWYNLSSTKTQLCGRSPSYAFDQVGGGAILTKYIDYTPTGITPSTQYTVYNTENRNPNDKFDGGNYKYGVMIPMSGGTITHIVDVSPSGLLENWSACQ
jgi:hypothetical protein